MIHVGEKRYYAEIARRLVECDLIIAEGVSSKRSAILTMSYRIVKHIRRLDLVTQHEMDTSILKSKIINADIEGGEFEKLYSNLPILDRLQILILSPAFALYLLLFGTRKFIASELATEDLPTSEEILADDFSERLEEVTLTKRDCVLVQKLQDLIEDRAQEGMKIGILYGARHMRTVVAFLFNKFGYNVGRAEWVTVFDL
jgi:hypothetical protein